MSSLNKGYMICTGPPVHITRALVQVVCACACAVPCWWMLLDKEWATPLVRAGDKVASIKPALLAEILSDPAVVAERCVRLRDALPHANVSQMVALQPSLLLEVQSVADGPNISTSRHLRIVLLAQTDRAVCAKF